MIAKKLDLTIKNIKITIENHDEMINGLRKMEKV